MMRIHRRHSIRLTMLALISFLLLAIYPAFAENSAPQEPTITSTFVNDKQSVAEGYQDIPPVFVPRMPDALERANEIFNNSGDIATILTPSSTPIKQSEQARHSTSIPPASLLIASTFGLLFLLLVASFTQNISAQRHAIGVATSPEGSFLR